MAGRAMRIGFMAQTEEKTYEVMVAGDAGLLAVSPPWFKAKWECGRVVWPNGAQAFPFTPEKPGNVRGPGVHLMWLSEIQSWPNSTREEAFFNALLMCSLGYAKTIWDATPKRRHPIQRQLIKDAEREPHKYHVISARIEENRDNLAPGMIEDLRAKLDNTQRGREELDGVFSDDDSGALWKQEWIDAARRDAPTELRRRVIAVDPAISKRRNSDQTGIADVGLGVDGQVLVFGDHTAKYSWEEWGDLVLELYVSGRCDCVVVERNRGGDAVVANLRARGQSPERIRTGKVLRVELLDRKAQTRHVPGVVYVKETTSRQSKAERAGPVASMAEAGRISHVRGANLTELEDLLTTWAPDPREDSPDRMDAFVFGVWEVAGLGLEEQRDKREGYRGVEKVAQALRTGRRPGALVGHGGWGGRGI